MNFDIIGQVFNTFFFEPGLNGLVFLDSLLFHNFGLAIIAFTVAVRLIMMPLTLRQLHMSKAMSALQPRMKEIQQRYAQDRSRISGETMKLYREAGVNPVGCLVPTVIQFPIWIALYYAIVRGLAVTPTDLLGLAQSIYPGLVSLIPLNSNFLWFNLADPDPSRFLLPVLVGASMWIQQKMSTLPAADPQQQSMNRMMQTTMPLMFGFFTLSFPSGLALYWIVSNGISIIIQYFVTGWGDLRIPAFVLAWLPIGGAPAKPGRSGATPGARTPTPPAAVTSGQGDAAPAGQTKNRKRTSDGKSGSKRKVRR